MTDFERLTTTFDSLGIDYTVRIHPDDESYKYLFYGAVRWDDDFETTDLDKLLCGNRFFEFEDDELVSY